MKASNKKKKKKKWKKWLASEVETMFMDFLFYDRQGDQEAPADKVRRLMDNGVITKKMMIKVFTNRIDQEYK